MHIVGERRCIACRNSDIKSNLIRISKNEDEILLCDDKKKVGRGVYLCKKNECIELCLKKKLLNKAFRTNIDDTVYERLKTIKF